MKGAQGRTNGRAPGRNAETGIAATRALRESLQLVRVICIASSVDEAIRNFRIVRVAGAAG